MISKKNFRVCWFIILSLGFTVVHAANYELHRYGYIEHEISQITWSDSDPPPRRPILGETMAVTVDKSGAVVFVREGNTGLAASYVDPSEEVINLVNKNTVFTVTVDNGFADLQGLPTGGPTKYGMLIQGIDGVVHYGEYTESLTGSSDAIDSEILNGLKNSFLSSPFPGTIAFSQNSINCNGSTQCLIFTINSPPKNTVVTYVKHTCDAYLDGYDGPCDSNGFILLPNGDGTHRANGKLMMNFVPTAFNPQADYAFTLHWGQNKTARISAADARCTGVASTQGVLGCFANLISIVTGGQVVTKCLNHWQQLASTCSSPNVEKLLIDTTAGKAPGILYPTSDLSDAVQSDMLLSNNNVSNENLNMEEGLGLPIATRSIAFNVPGQVFPHYEGARADDRGVIWTGESLPNDPRFEQSAKIPIYNNGIVIYSTAYNAPTMKSSQLIVAIDYSVMPTPQIKIYDTPPGISMIGVVVPVTESSGRERIWFSTYMDDMGSIAVFNKEVIDTAIQLGDYAPHECAPDESADINPCFQIYRVPTSFNVPISYGLRWVNGASPEQSALWFPSTGLIERLKPLNTNGDLTKFGVMDLYSQPLTTQLDFSYQDARNWITDVVWLPKSGELAATDYAYSNVLLLDPDQATTTNCVLQNDDGTAPCVKRLDVSPKKPPFGPYGTNYGNKTKNLAYDAVRNLLWMVPGVSFPEEVGPPLGYIKLAGIGEKNFNSSNSAWNSNSAAWDFLPLPLGSGTSLGGWVLEGKVNNVNADGKADYRHIGVLETVDVAANGDIVVANWSTAYNRIVLDFDGDGVADNWEVTYSLNPLDPSDAGITALNGFTYLYDYQNGLNPTLLDNDGDGLTDVYEVNTSHTDPLNLDTDGDGVSDHTEVTNCVYGATHNQCTNPLLADTDGDLMADGWEVRYGLDPLVNDAGSNLDGDLFTNLLEYKNLTDPTNISYAKYDFNGDHYADVLLRNTSTGDWNLAQLSGMAVLNQGSVSGGIDTGFANTGVTVATADFNGDGKVDILTRSTAGSNPANTFHIDLMNGASVIGFANLTTMSNSSDDVVMSTKDFNRDGKADVLLRNSATGVWTINYMNGTNAPTIAILNASTNTCYQLLGDGDYDGNGYPDILLRKENCGGSSYPWLIYFTNGTSSIPTSSTGPGLVLSTGWSAVVTDKDFNGDGISDILVRVNSGSPQLWYLYYMQGSGAPSSASGTLNIAVQSVWQFASAGDFNGDGKADIMLRSTGTGQWYIYLSNNTLTPPGAVPMNISNFNLNWDLQRVDDNNGDGRSDILLRNTSTGQWWLYLMNGLTATLSPTALPINTSLSYVLQNH